MPTPMDFPAFSLLADTDQNTTFAAVGRLMSFWESFEFDLSRLYCVFVGDPDGAAMQEYGAGQIFRMRLENLHVKADSYFVRNPSQEIEGAYDQLMSLVTFYADRRNEIAHGIVMDVSGLSFFKNVLAFSPEAEHQFMLIPPYYLVRKHHKSGAPHYGYSSNEINRLAYIIFEYELRIRDFREMLLGKPSEPS